MRKTGLIVVFIIILFIAPSAYTPQMMPTLDGGSRPVESGPTSADGGYPLSTGTGQALTTHILGTVVNGTEVPVQIDTDNMAVGTIGITGDYAGTGIGATLDTFTMTVPNALRNPDLNDWHEERWHVGDPTFYDDKVAIPDSWTLVKSISNPSESPHPHHGDWEFNDGGGGYAGSRGFRFDATLPTGYLLTSTDKIYISQHVHAPWRDLYSATIRFQYYVRAASQMGDLVHLFTRFAGVETQFRVFESGDTKDTWLPAIVEIPSSSLTSVNLPDSLLFEIGLGTNFDGITATGPDEYVFIDEIELELEVRPFPEQVGLRVNGTEVVGSTPGSTFPFVPDDITGDTGRDCWDDTSGIDLDGYDNDGNLEVGIWGTDWLTSNPFEVGLQFRLDIPQGAVIERAYLETEASGQQNLVDRRVHIAGENSSGLPVDPFENHLGLHLEDEFNWIQTSIDWQPDYWTSDVRYSSPDIAPLLQKVVSNSDWAAGQYVAIMLSYAWSSSYQSRNDLKGSNHPSWNNYTQDEMARFYVWYRIPHSDDVIPTNEDFARNSLQFRKDITIDSAKVTEDLSDFPVLIDLYDTDLRTDVRPDGEDIAFIVGGQFVEHEVELFEQDYNTTHAHLVAWVKIPSLSSSVDTVITMLYGNLIVTGLQSSGVWDGYEIVQHMNDNPNGISYDSTYNHHSGPSFGSMTIGDLVPGAIGNATDFDGQDDVISVGQIETDDWPSFTVSGWIYHDVSGDDRVFSKAPNTNEANAIIHFAVDDTDKFRVRMNTDGVGGGASLSVDSIGFTAPGSWYYLTWSWSAATEEMRLHINGTFDRTAARDGDTVLNSYVPFVIGNWQTGTGNNRFFDGMIDEIRMTTRVLSDGWIATEYANQKSPSSFYLVGPEQTSSGLPDIKSAALVFSSESPIPVSIGFTMSMDFEGTGKSLDENLNEGTTFYATNGSSTVEWTAKVLVSPPPGITQTEVYVEYPATEWTPISVANPLGQSKTAPAEWTFTGGRLAIAASAVDVYGLWTIKFESLSYIADLEFDLGGGTYADTAVFQINDDLEMRATSFWLAGSTSQLFLTDPSGSLWSTPLSNTTGGSPQHEIPSFVYRKVITVDRNKVQQDFTDFPVLIDIVDSDLDDKAQTDGDDIVFVQNGIIVPHEIVDYDPAYSGTEARLVAWIRANVSSSVDTDITMYYGNSLVGPQEQPSEVWSNGYVGVWHLEESPSGTSGEIKDSTSYRNDGTTEGSMNSADLISAMIGNGLDFDEIDDLIRVSDSVSLDSVASSGTIQMWIWFDMDAADGDRDVIMESSNRFDGNPDDGFELATQEDGDLFFYPWGGEGNDYNIALNQFANQTWHLLTVALDYSTKTVDFYVDGSLIAFTYEGAPTYWTQLAEPTDWLWGGDPDMPARYFDGRFDEIRVSNTVRSQTWLQTEFNNQDDPGSFSLVGSEQQRQFYYPEFKKTLDSTAPAGVWTATVRFNDSGSAIDYRVGIYERNFTVKHDTMLTLQEPSDAVVDRLSIAVAGDWIYIEYKLEDSVNSQSLSGVTVTMNWTVSGSGTLVTLDDYNTGVYGRMLNTADLGDAKRWRINLQTSHPFYNNATEYFDLDLYHSTSLDYGGVMTTPADFNFSAILTFTDVYDNVPIEGATITRSDAGPLTVAELGQGLYNISIETTALSLGDHWYVLEAEKPGYLFEISTTNVTFTLRQHYTSVSVQGDLTQPYGFNTDLTIVLTDLDTGGTVPLSEVSSFSFNPASYGVQNRPGSSYDVTLTTNTWSVTEPASETVTLSVVMSGTKYATPQPYSFDITIRAHYTSLTVSGVVVQPFGNVTPLTVFLWDHDTEASVPIGEVGEFSFARGFDIDTFSNPSSYDVMYDTSDWAVGIWSVTLSVDIPSSVYQNPSDYTFSVTIRSMTTVMYHDPKDLVFSAGEDFTIDLRVNVSEPGDSYGLPVRSLTQAEFSEPSYPFTVDNAAQNIGKYTFTISWSDLSGVGVYTITVYLTPLNASHGSTQLVITFRYRDVISTLTSPNYPQVTTPYQTDVQILLNYTDVEGGVGIDSATVSSPDHPEYIANWTDVGGGIYSVWIDVSTLAKGTHYFNLTVSRPSYTARTLRFQILVRIAYTYAIPTVGALDIPLGNSPEFYVDYWDIDHNKPVDNSSAPYTSLESTWYNFSVTYVPAQQRYRVVFMTSDSDSLVVNQIYTFNFSRGENYQFGIFNITVTIRTHNTDFRLTTAVEPTSNIGIINMTVYYGDLDNGFGVDSAFVDLRVENESGPVVSTPSSLGSGFYLIQIDADQFGLGFQTFTVYADWTGPVAKYQNKNFVTTANIIGLESTLTLLLASEPTPYYGNMSYKFFYSDLGSGAGIHNLTYNVFVYVSFQGESVDLSQVSIIDYSATQQGNYSIQFNTSIFDRTGLIYMNVFVNWSKGVAPFYQNRTDVVTLRVLPRDTLVSVTPPSPTSYGENATYSFTYEDVAGAVNFLIGDSPSLTISSNVTFSYTETAGSFEIEFNTTQFGGLGQQAIRLDIVWSGVPFYANRTNRIVFITVLARQTFLAYLAPAPTQYSDIVSFNVTWTDITGGSSDGITAATLTLYEGAVPINSIYYNWTEIPGGIYSVDLSATYHAPGTYDLTVVMSAGVFYIEDSIASRQFAIRERITLLSAEPVRTVPYNSSIEVILYYQDLFTTDIIANGSGDLTLEILTPGVWYFTIEWKPVFGYYVLKVETYNHPELLIGTQYTLTLNMSYAYQAPYYASDDVVIDYELRIRKSTISLDTPPESTAYGNDATFIILYNDADADEGIVNADISLYLNSTLLAEGADYILSQGPDGYYTFDLDTTVLAGLGLNILSVHANWSGTPYHENLTTIVNVLVRERGTIIEITQPPSQVQYLDDVTFTFVYRDLDTGVAGGTPVLGLTSGDVRLFCENGTEILSGYSFVPSGSGYEIVVNSAGISDVLDSNYNLTLIVDWDGATAPYYADRTTSLRVSIAGRVMNVEPDLIETTPITGPAGTDNMTISFRVSDAGNNNPIDGAIILFSCQEQASFTYWLTTGPQPGEYTINVDTASLTSGIGPGVYHFDLEVRWNPLLAPYYSNRSAMTRTGWVDLVVTNLEADVPIPAAPQIGEYVMVNVTFYDLDHGPVEIDGASIFAQYLGGPLDGIVPQDFVATPTGTPGEYNVSFSTADIPDEGSYTVRITASKVGYVQGITTSTVSAQRISTEVVPQQISYNVNWTETIRIYVNYTDLLNGIGISLATVTWSYSPYYIDESFTESGLPGQYWADVNTISGTAGTWVLSVKASLDRYQLATTTVTLVVLPLPSEIVIETPAEEVPDVSRGDPVDVVVFLNDIQNAQGIDFSYVEEVYLTFQGQEYAMGIHNGTIGFYDGQLPGAVTGSLEPRAYDVRITARLTNYELAINQFKVNILQTETQVSVWDAQRSEFNNGTPESLVIEAVYLEVVNFTVQVIAPAFSNATYTEFIENATVDWVFSRWGVDYNFTNKGNGIFELLFDTSEGSYGTWGLTFSAEPDNRFFAIDDLLVTLVIKKIPTEVVTPIIEPKYWGWKGNLTFTYYDTHYDTGVIGATVTYSYLDLQNLNATRHGDGNYSIYIDTTRMVPSATTRYPILVTFDKGEGDYESRTAGVQLLVLEVPTEILVNYTRIYDGGFTRMDGDVKIYDMEIPLGGAIDFEFYYNDTEGSDGYIGGLSGSSTNLTELFGENMQKKYPHVTDIGDGRYTFTFDTSHSSLFDAIGGIPEASPGKPYTFSISLWVANRTLRTVRIRITIIEVPTLIEVVDSSLNIGYGLEGYVIIRYWDTWSDVPITGADIVATIDNQYVTVTYNGTEATPGYYRITFAAGAAIWDIMKVAQTVDIEFEVSMNNYQSHTQDDLVEDLTVVVALSPTEEMINRWFPILTPLSLAIIVLLGAYIRVWSVPKRLRQINAQIKALRKGKIPKPIDEAKSRQELLAELFNDTYSEVDIKRESIQMPEESVTVEVPEMGELLIQLQIMTHLSPEELEEFKGDISKMRVSEQATFVKEVIMQEAMRAARRDGKTIDDVLEAVRLEALKRLKGEEELIEPGVPVVPEEKPMILVEEEEEAPPPVEEEEVTPEAERPEMEEVVPSDRLSEYEIEELRKELKARGVPPHEIDTIMEQAKVLPRELVGELVKSLGGEK